MALALQGEDAAWLHMESPASPMHVGALVELDGALDPDRLVARIEARLLSNERFRSRVVEPTLHIGPPRWSPIPSFDVRAHVERSSFDGSREPAVHLRDFISRQMSVPLDRAGPLWKAHVIDLGDRSTAIFFRVHHAIADGFALLGSLLALCDEGTTDATTPPVRDHAHRLRDLGAGTARIVGLPADPPTAIRGSLGSVKRVAWTRPLPLDQVKAIARACGASVNDVLVAVAAGAVARHLRRRDGTAPVSLRAMVPVNLRKGSLAEAHGNRFGLVLLDLPTGELHPRARVTEVRLAMSELKTNAEALVSYGLLWSMGLGPQSIERVGARFFGEKASLVVTNIIGPRHVLHLDGVPVRRAMFWVPQAAGIGLGISIFSYAGTVTIGVLADAGLVAEPGDLASDVEEGLAELTRT